MYVRDPFISLSLSLSLCLSLGVSGCMVHGAYDAITACAPTPRCCDVARSTAPGRQVATPNDADDHSSTLPHHTTLPQHHQIPTQSSSLLLPPPAIGQRDIVISVCLSVCPPASTTRTNFNRFSVHIACGPSAIGNMHRKSVEVCCCIRIASLQRPMCTG